MLSAKLRYILIYDTEKKKEAARCLGCGVCTTRCKFDAIHLRKRTYVSSISYEKRTDLLPKFIAERQKKIEIRKIGEQE